MNIEQAIEKCTELGIAQEDISKLRPGFLVRTEKISAYVWYASGKVKEIEIRQKGQPNKVATFGYGEQKRLTDVLVQDQLPLSSHDRWSMHLSYYDSGKLKSKEIESVVPGTKNQKLLTFLEYDTLGHLIPEKSTGNLDQPGGVGVENIASRIERDTLVGFLMFVGQLYNNHKSRRRSA